MFVRMASIVNHNRVDRQRNINSSIEGSFLHSFLKLCLLLLPQGNTAFASVLPPCTAMSTVACLLWSDSPSLFTVADLLFCDRSSLPPPTQFPVACPLLLPVA